MMKNTILAITCMALLCGCSTGSTATAVTTAPASTEAPSATSVPKTAGNPSGIIVEALDFPLKDLEQDVIIVAAITEDKSLLEGIGPLDLSTVFTLTSNQTALGTYDRIVKPAQYLATDVTGKTVGYQIY